MQNNVSGIAIDNNHKLLIVLYIYDLQFDMFHLFEAHRHPVFLELLRHFIGICEMTQTIHIRLGCMTIQMQLHSRYATHD